MGLLKFLIEIGGNASGYYSTLAGIRSRTAQVAGEVGEGIKGKLAGAFTVGAVTAFSATTAGWAKNVDLLAKKFDVSTDTIQVWQKVAGDRFDQFAQSLQALGKARSDALNDPDGNQMDAFRKLGISVDDLKKKRLEELLDQYSVALRNVSGPQEVLAAMMTTLGGEGATMFDILRNGFAGVAEEMTRTGEIMDKELVAKWATFQGAWRTSWSIMRNIAVNALTPVLQFFNATIGSLITATGTLFAGMKRDAGPNATMWQKLKSLLNPSAQTNQEVRQAFIETWDKAWEKPAAQEPSKTRGPIRYNTKRPEFHDTGMAVDALAKIGGFTARADKALQTVMEKQLAVQERTADATETIARQEDAIP